MNATRLVGIDLLEDRLLVTDEISCANLIKDMNAMVDSTTV